jgi:phage tail sheath protein FI
MAELTFQSPGVSVREIDLSGPTRISPSGIPAGVIGTAIRGPAFVPVTVATFQDFISKFGATDGEKFGPLAMNEWLTNARSGTYVRILGVGDAKKRSTSTGRVTNAGFVVGSQLVAGNGQLGDNDFAYSDKTGEGPQMNDTSLGRTYFLGAFMQQTENSSIFTEAGMGFGTYDETAHPILRGVVMAPSGVILGLSSSMLSNNVVSLTGSVRGQFGSASLGFDAGAPIGDVVIENGAQDFVMLLNGHKVSSTSGNSIRASFDPKSANYFSKVFNTDPTKIEEFGHYLYSHYDVDSKYAVVTGSGITPIKSARTFGEGHHSTEVDGTQQDHIAFLLTGSAGRNQGTASTASTIGLPNYDNWENRFHTAFSPFIISQRFGGRNQNLFRLHALDDGAVAAGAYKVSIEEIAASSDQKYKYGTFRVLIRAFGDTDENRVILETFNNVNLDPSSDRYVARVIGDRHVYYDFDKGEGRQKLVIDGLYPNRSRFVRVEVSDDLENGNIDEAALPMGFRGINHLITSGSTSGRSLLTGSMPEAAQSLLGISTDELKRVVQPPLPFREHLAKGVSPKQKVKSALNWGVQWELKHSLTEPNKNTKKVDPSIAQLVKYFPEHHLDSQAPWVGNNDGAVIKDGTVLDADVFNNNMFTLERIEVLTASNDRPDARQWVAARYRRDEGTAALTDKDGTTKDSDSSRLIDASKDFDHQPSRRYLKFTLPMQGGFDGVNIFNKDKSHFRDAAVRREMDNANQGLTNGSTVAAYRKALDVMEAKSDVDIQLLAIPGVRHESITDYAIDAIERRFDAMLVMDVEEKDELGVFVTGTVDTLVNVASTVSSHTDRALDSSFAAAYFPDVIVTDPTTGQNVQAPPTVAVLGAFGLNDRLAHPWFAPAGFTRGSLDRVLETKVKLNRANLDELYSADINPLLAFPGQNGPIVFGQKTLLAAASALDRVNVRRLLIDVRRKVKAVANTLLFEPNRESTLASFSAAVDPILATIQAQQGIDRFKVTIDTTTTTQTDVENNTIRGKIFLQPTRAVEFISLDFVVTNAGSDV